MDTATIIDMFDHRRYAVLRQQGGSYTVPTIGEVRDAIQRGQVLLVRNCRSSKGSNPGLNLEVHGDVYPRMFYERYVDSVFKWPVHEFVPEDESAR